MDRSRARTLILGAALTAAAILPISALGFQERGSLATVDRLLAEGDRSAALQELARLHRANPELFDQIAKRLDLALEQEEQFIGALENLLVVLDSPTDSQEVVRALEEVERLRPRPSAGETEAQRTLLRAARGLVEYRAANAELVRVRGLAEQLKADGRYADAYRAYLEGARSLTLMSPEPSPRMTEAVASLTDLLGSAAGVLAQADLVLSAPAAQTPVTLPWCQERLDLLEGLTVLRRQASTLLAHASNPHPPESISLSHAASLSLWMIHSMDGASARIVKDTCRAIQRVADPELETLLAALEDPAQPPPIERARELRALYSAGLEVAAYAAAAPWDSPSRMDTASGLSLLLTMQERALEMGVHQELAGLRWDARELEQSSPETRVELNRDLDVANAIVAQLKALANRWPHRISLLERVENQGPGIGALLESARELDRSIQDSLPLASRSAELLSVRAGVLARDELDRLAPEVEQLAAAVTAMAGASSLPSSGALDTTETRMQELIDRIQSYGAEWTAIALRLSRGRDVTRQLSRAAELQAAVEKSAGLVSELRSKQAKIAGNVVLWRQQGLARYQSGKTNLSGGRATQALEDFGAARDLFDRVLAQGADAELARLRDGELIRSYEEASKLFIAGLVRGVRQTMDQAVREFGSRQYEAALQSFQTARTQWAWLTTLDNQELTAWMGLAAVAQGLEARQIVPETHPRYREVQDLYRQALADYGMGEQLLRDGKTRDALSAFRDAESALSRVRRIVPFHRDSRVLSLRIVQLSDQQRFPLRLASEIRSAQAKVASSPEDAYLDLKVLQEVAPDNRELQTAVAALEAKLALGVRPVSAADREEAGRLRNAAVLAAPIEAYALLDKALTLDPLNAAIAADKDRLLWESNMLAGTLLTYADQVQYDRAVSLKSQGERQKALEIANELLKTPRNWQFASLVQLQRELSR